MTDSIKVKIALSNYEIKTDLKNVTHIATSSFALKTNLASLKTEVDKLRHWQISVYSFWRE